MTTFVSLAPGLYQLKHKKLIVFKPFDYSSSLGLCSLVIIDRHQVSPPEQNVCRPFLWFVPSSFWGHRPFMDNNESGWGLIFHTDCSCDEKTFLRRKGCSIQHSVSTVTVSLNPKQSEFRRRWQTPASRTELWWVWESQRSAWPVQDVEWYVHGIFVFPFHTADHYMVYKSQSVVRRHVTLSSF